MADWGSLIDNAIRSIINDGVQTHLPGAGKPLPLDDDPHTPDELKLAHKLLKENDLAPDWIMQARELDGTRERLLEELRRAAAAYRGALADAARESDAGRSAVLRHRAESTWEHLRGTFETAAVRFNRTIVTYNLKVPAGIAHKALLDLKREIALLLK